MTGTSGGPASDDDAPVRVATYPNPHEAEVARAALASERIDSVVLHDHGQYLSAAAWVQLQVARRDCSRAVALLERGPAHAITSAAEPDDMRPLRLQRRFTLARWFLYRAALFYLLTGLLLPLVLVPLGLVLWSRRDPRKAFALAILQQILVVFVSTAIYGLFGLSALIPLLAFHFAWVGAAPEPPKQLAASLFPSTPSILIGESWKVGGEQREPVEQSIWIFRPLGWFLFAVVVVYVIGQMLR